MIQKDLKIVAMIFHIAPCRIRDRKYHRSDNRWRPCGSVLSFCPESQKSGLYVNLQFVNQCWPRLPPCVAGAGAVPAWCGTGRRSTGPGFEPWSATGQPSRAAPPPAATTIQRPAGSVLPRASPSADTSSELRRYSDIVTDTHTSTVHFIAMHKPIEECL